MTIRRISNTTICSIFLTYKSHHCNIFYWGRPKRGIYAVSYSGHTRCKPVDWLFARLQRPTRAIDGIGCIGTGGVVWLVRLPHPRHGSVVGGAVPD